VKCKNPKCTVEFKPRGKLKVYCSRSCQSRTFQFQYNKIDRLTNPKKWIYNRAKESSKRGLEFTITMNDIPDIPEFCPVFPWIALKLPTGKGRGYYPDAPSIDRIDSNQGYIPGNIRIISWRANTLKSDGTREEFEAIIKDCKLRIH
jgi:hypothetical protein